MRRIQHPWDRWEDFRYNFYGGQENTVSKERSLELYASLLRDLPRFEAALQKITTEWVYACEHNLTNKSLNRIAWLGQAACALVYNVPHTVSCSGYNLLTEEEQARADAMAQKYLDLWVAKHLGEKDVATEKVQGD